MQQDLVITLRLHGQFFTCDYNAIFRNYCVAIAGKKLQSGYKVRWQNLLKEKLPEYSQISIFLQFLEGVAVSAQDVLHTEICTCESKAIIS